MSRMSHSISDFPIQASHRFQDNPVPNSYEIPFMLHEPAYGTFYIGTEQNVTIYARSWKPTREQTGEIKESRWAHVKFLDKTSLFLS